MPPISRLLRIARRVVLGLLLLILPFFVGLYIYLDNHATEHTRDIMDSFARDNGLTMTVESVGVDLLPLPSLTLVNARIENHSLSTEAAYTRLTPSLTALLRGEMLSGTVHFIRPRVSIVLTQGDGHAGHATSPVFDESLLRNFWPEYSRLKIDDGQVNIRFDDGSNVLLDGLHCDLAGGKSLSVRGRLGLERMYVSSPDLPDTTFSGLKMEGENSLFSLHPGEPRIRLAFDVQSGAWLARSHVDLDLRGHWQQWQLGTYLSGNFLKDGTPLPYVFRGQFSHDAASQPRQVAARDVHISLGRDSAIYNGTLRLPSSTGRLLDEAGIGGTLEVRRVSLTEWLGFARLLPAGLQHTLDTVSDGVLQFDMDGKGLRVPQIVASCQGSTFTGKGGVEDWRKPVVFLDLLAPQVNLGAAIPEAVAILPKEPDYGHGPLTPEGTTPTPEEQAAKAKARAAGKNSEEILVGYDINLGAGIVNYGPLVINDARVRIHPGPYDKDNNSDCLLDATAGLYKGTFKGQLTLGWQDWLPYTITASTSGIDGRGIAKDLPVLPFTGGVWQGEARVTSKGKQLDVFLASLRGNATVEGRRGGLPVPLPGHEGTALSLALTGGAWKDNHLGLNGQWQGSLTGKDMQLAGATTGQIWFGERTQSRDVVDFDNLRGWLRVHGAAGLLGLTKPLDARLEGVFDWQPQQLVIRDAHVQALGATARGQWRITEEGGGVAFQGPVEIDVPQLSTTLAAWGQHIKVPTFLPSLKGKAEVSAAKGSFALSKLQLKTGHTTATGSLSGMFPDQTGKKPFNADITLDMVDIDRYFPVRAKPENKKKDTDGGGHTLTAGSDTTPTRKNVPAGAASHSGTSLDFSAVKNWAAQGSVRVQALVCRKVRLQKLHIPFVLQNGKLTVAKLDGQAYGGPVRGSGHVLFGQTLGLKGNAQATNVNLAPAMRERNMLMQGTAEVYADLAASLATTADWPRALNGSWRFAMHNGQFQNADRDGRPKGKPTAFSLAQATGNIQSGVLYSRDILLRGPELTLRGNGKLDLPQEYMDCEFDVNMSGMPDFPMRLYGNLDKPRTSIGAGTLILNALGGLGSGLLDTVGGLFTGIGRIFTPQANR